MIVVSGCIALSAPVGLCVLIWRYDCVESLIVPVGDGSPSAFWVFLVAAIPSGLVAIAGAMTLYLTLLRSFPGLIPGPRHSGRRFEGRMLRWERRMAVAWSRNIRLRHRRFAEAKAKEDAKGASEERARGDESGSGGPFRGDLKLRGCLWLISGALLGGLIGMAVLSAWLSWSDAQDRVAGRGAADPLSGGMELIVRGLLFYPASFIAGAVAGMAVSSIAMRIAAHRRPGAKDTSA
jgi:hypothetical protein